jgi:hypothetical protein
LLLQSLESLPKYKIETFILQHQQKIVTPQQEDVWGNEGKAPRIPSRGIIWS